MIASHAAPVGLPPTGAFHFKRMRPSEQATHPNQAPAAADGQTAARHIPFRNVGAIAPTRCPEKTQQHAPWIPVHGLESLLSPCRQDIPIRREHPQNLNAIVHRPKVNNVTVHRMTAHVGAQFRA